MLSTELSPHVAVVGAGPSGCYAALALRKQSPAAQITLFDSRPLPFGLIRNGIAPDHQGMKVVARQFERLFDSSGVRFVGNTRIGDDLPVSALAAFDGVIFATGLEQDRRLHVQVAPAARVFGAGEIIRLLNGDPDGKLREYPHRELALGAELIVVGTGNVAIDLLRLIAKTDGELVGSDIVDEARDALATTSVRRITVLGRGARDRARWDAAMFAELCALSSAAVYVDGDVAHSPNQPQITIDIRFNHEVADVLEVGGRTVVRTGGGDSFEADAVITALGFISADDDDLLTEAQETLRTVVRAGGCSAGVLGNLAQNRLLGRGAASQLLAQIASAEPRPGFPAIEPILPAHATNYDHWRLVDRVELGRADAARCRRKLTSRQQIADAIRKGSDAEPSASPA